MEYYLKHHGIKGQKWGVSNGPPYPLSYSAHNESEKKANWTSSLDKGDIRVKKGTSISRISAYDESNSKGTTYATYLKSDTNYYKSFFGRLVKSRGLDPSKNENPFQVKMEAAEDLVSPGLRKRIDLWLETYKDVQMEKSFDAYKTRFYYMMSSGNGKNLSKNGYRIFQNELGNSKKTYLRDKYFEKLRQNGYNMLIDDNDAGRYSKKPIIILDREKSTIYKGQQRLNDDDLKLIKRHKLNTGFWDKHRINNITRGK